MNISSLYDLAITKNQNILNTGFDYKSNNILIQKVVSPYLYRNDILVGFLNQINDVMLINIEAIKKIRIHNNFTVNKETKYIN